MKNNNRSHQGLLDIVVIATSLGITLFVCICIGVFLGYYVDQWLGTTPWALIGFSLLGAITGFWSLYKKALAYMKESDYKDGEPR